MLTDAAQLYSDVFAPELFVLICGFCLIGYEWRGIPDRADVSLGGRLSVLALGWAVGLVLYKGVPALLGTVPNTVGCNFVEISATPVWRYSPRDYSRQYNWGPDATGIAVPGVGAYR